MNDAPRLYRLIVQVNDLDRAATFYAALLGAPGRHVPGRRHYFDCGDVILAVVDTGRDARPLPDHLYFSVRDLDAAYARAKELGCLAAGEVHGEPAGEIRTRPWGERCFYATDPFGNPLCFVDELTLYTGR